MELVVSGIVVALIGALIIAVRHRYYAHLRKRIPGFWRAFGLEPTDGYFRASAISLWAVAVGAVLLGMLLIYVGFVAG